jgi:hypothetical protein
MMSAARDPIGAVPAKQEWNLRWLAILVGAAGYVAGGGPSKVSVLTGNAMAGLGQISVQGPDGIYYETKTGPVKFVAVEWTLEGVTRRSVVWVNCRS